MSDIPAWAFDRAAQITNEFDESAYDGAVVERTDIKGYSLGQAFAKYISEHEPAPVDPLLIEAREFCALALDPACEVYKQSDYRKGSLDNCVGVKAALAALKSREVQS